MITETNPFTVCTSAGYVAALADVWQGELRVVDADRVEL